MVIQAQNNTAATIASYIEKEAVTYIDAETPDEAIDLLIEKLSLSKNLIAKEEFKNAILQREKMASTGIGMGVAIPHAKLPIYNDFFIAVGVLKKGIQWNAMDHIPVKLVFLVGGPDDKQTEYLKLLSQLTLYLRDEETRKKLLTITAPEQMIQIFES